MGWWPSKLCVVLAAVVSFLAGLEGRGGLTHRKVILGYGLVDAVTTGLILAAVSGGSMTSIVGIVRQIINPLET